MYSYNEVELRTRNITACDQEMFTFLVNHIQKNIVEGCSFSIHMACDRKAFKSSKSNDNSKKKVGFKILELETTKEQAITRALLSWRTIAWQINAIFFFFQV